MIRVPTLEELDLIVNTNISDKDDLGETISLLHSIDISSTELKLIQYRLELSYIIIQTRQTYAIT